MRRSKHHALYALEQAVEYRPGTAFLYSMDTLVRPAAAPLFVFVGSLKGALAQHRGTPVKEGGTRLAHHLVFRRASAEWHTSSGNGFFIPALSASSSSFAVLGASAVR